MDGDDNETPQIVEINYDLDIPAQDPPPIELEPDNEAEIEIETVVTPASIEALPLRRSTRCRSQTKQKNTPSMTGKRYGYASTQLETYWTTKYDFSIMKMLDQVVLNLDAHMFAQQDFYQSEPDVVAAIMTQLSLKVVLREWGYKSHTEAT